MDSPAATRADHTPATAYNGVVGSRRSRVLLAFDAGSLCLARLTRTLRGQRLEGLQRHDLEPGVLQPSPLEPNLRNPDAVREAVGRLLARGRMVRAPATLVLPDGIARVALLDPPAAVDARAFARFRLSASLPFPATEAIVDVLPVHGRRVLAVAVRRSVIEAYEAVAAACGLEVDRVLLSPVVGFEGLRRLGAGNSSTVDLILGDAAYSLAAWKDGEVRVFRSRRRDVGRLEVARLREEILRSAALAGDGMAPRVRVVGPGSAAVLREMQGLGDAAEPGWQASGETMPVEAAEIPWLGLGL